MTHRETRGDVAQDPLTALLKPIFMGSDFYHVAKQCGDWLLSHEHAVAPSFHLVTEGQCRLAWHDGGEEHLQAGDLAFFPGDAPHQLTPQGVSTDTPTQVVPLRSSRPGVGLICGHFRFVHDVPPAWFGALPRIVRIPRQARGQTFQHAVEAFAEELSNGDAPGHAPVTNALANALLILMLRHCLETRLLDQRHLMAFLDTPVSRALKLLHEDPRCDWTLHELARAVGLSRSSFSERFHRVVGMTVVRYQGRLRMILADQALANGESIVGAMLASGYRSESTFRKAYKRIRGVPPSRLKTHATE
ncbi:AraC family transcriptional regulator [Chromohalobacter marismortui]|uniref:AraC family transcriptional regulator n=1 Tax=Chromohalobacter marismortui TaxID=42055 RepID=A0A4R7NN68_9GAMM|nr:MULTISPECIES: AraC family transcriptional regulator [Chromohalobacter]MCI0509575.1 AraC family transcriptional regulator [Chromohalobacter sp.]MCI0592531.1 AraC family transcriptional regulator [Chromohalobacter sp.]TDU22295.1 AraC family transcriptional regulator [Chromohalobacter marismortui]